MAGSQSDAVFAFLQQFRRPLAAVVRSILGELSRVDLCRDRCEVDAFVLDAALVIYAHAGRWRPEGAPPWVWARRAIRADVVRTIGHPRVGADVVELLADLPWTAAGPGSRPGPGDTAAGGTAAAEVERLSWRYPLLVDLLGALERTTRSARDRQVFLEYRLQQRLGDPSPARTVAAQFALSEANARQIYSRISRALAVLLQADPTFADLASLPLLTRAA